MFTPLVPIAIDSIYRNRPLPERMARCTPDMLAALTTVAKDLVGISAQVILSDLFRSYEMQLQAHQDYVSGKKTAFSPPPGGSMHEAGRAFDLDLGAIKRFTLSRFWSVAERHGLSPIVNKPDPSLSEAWHFDCRGSHAVVYDYYKAGKGDNFKSAYTAMAASAIVSIGQKVDALGTDPLSAYIQSGLIRLGYDVGDLDGRIGPKTRNALAVLEIDPVKPIHELAAAVDRKLQEAFPNEFFAAGVQVAGDDPPEHLIDTLLPQTQPRPLSSASTYTPSAMSRAVLGTIGDQVRQATAVVKEFDRPPKFIGKLAGGQLYFDSNLELDTDGSMIGSNGDSTWQSHTSLRYANKDSLDANDIPFFVLPLPTGWSEQFDIELGDYAAVIHKNFLAFAAFGDLGPKRKIGEGSIALLRQLGQERVKNGRIINSGMGPDVITIVFPGSGNTNHLVDAATLKANILKEGRKLFAELGGNPDAANPAVA